MQACEPTSSSSDSYEAREADGAAGTADSARKERTPLPSSGKEDASHCRRCTGEPSRAADARTEAHAPTRRSCSSVPSSAKLRPRSDSAAVSVRAARSCTTPMSCHSTWSRRRPRSVRRGPDLAPPRTARLEADRDRHPLVPGAAGHRHGGQRAVEDEDAQGRGYPGDVRLPTQHQHAEDEADGDREDLARPPAGERPAAARAGRSGSAHPARASRVLLPASGWPGGQAGGNDRTTGPWSSMSR